MSDVKGFPDAPMTVRQRAEAEVRKEQAEKAIKLMKDKLRNLTAAQAVVKGIEIEIADLERQIEDGTL